MDERIRRIFEDVLSMKINDLSELEKIEIDSLDFVNVLFQIESDFNLKISDEELKEHDLENIKNLISYVKNHIQS